MLRCEMIRTTNYVSFSSFPFFLGICMLLQHIADYKVPYKTLASDIEFVDDEDRPCQVPLVTAPLVT